MSLIVEVSIQQGLAEAVGNYVEDFPQAVAAALQTVADQVLATANVLVPVRTGFLKSTLGYRQDTNFQVTFYATAPYAPFVEFGTSRMSARLFLTRSIQQHEGDFPQAVSSALVHLCDNCFNV